MPSSGPRSSAPVAERASRKAEGADPGESLVGIGDGLGVAEGVTSEVEAGGGVAISVGGMGRLAG